MCLRNFYKDELHFLRKLELEIETIEGLRQVATFLTTLYIPYFISNSIRCDADINDLEMMKSLHKFSIHDQVMEEGTLAVLIRHTGT